MQKIFKLPITCSTMTRRRANSRLLCFCSSLNSDLCPFFCGLRPFSMQFLQALIAALGQHLKALMRLKLALLIEREIMHQATPVIGANNLSNLPVDNHLAFQGVALLFATLIGFLLFFGRCIGVSATSTTTNSISCSEGCNFFLPGQRKARLFVRMSWTLRIMRQTLDWWSPNWWRGGRACGTDANIPKLVRLDLELSVSAGVLFSAAA
jgi:hypothetical protein